MKSYLDSSVILRALLAEEKGLSLDEVEYGVTSSVTRLECFRSLDRLLLRGLLPPEEFSESRQLCLKLMMKFEVIHITEGLLALAESSFSMPVGSLDAIHLSSAILWQQKYRESLQFLTHDRELALAAISQGFHVEGY